MKLTRRALLAGASAVAVAPFLRIASAADHTDIFALIAKFHREEPLYTFTAWVDGKVVSTNATPPDMLALNERAKFGVVVRAQKVLNSAFSRLRMTNRQAAIGNGAVTRPDRDDALIS